MKYKHIGGRRIFLFIALALFISNYGYAITGSGGSIDMNGLLDSISYYSNSSIVSYGTGGIMPKSYYDGSYQGYFGPSNGILVDNYAPTITLLNPVDGSGTFNTSVNFLFNAADASLFNCSINVDGTSYNLLTNNGANSYSTTLSISQHHWNITCMDEYSNTAQSPTRMFTVLQASTFDNGTTDFSSVNMSAITNLSLSQSGNGKIVFSGVTDLSGGVNLNDVVKINGLNVIVDSTAFPTLNKSATVYIYNVPYSYTVIWKDGSVCSSCNVIDHSGGTLEFNVSGFSNYTITSTSSLSVYDDTDFALKYFNQPVIFYANYSNITSGAPITANCDIAFYNGSWSAPNAMYYDNSVGVYYYNTTFNNSDETRFNVNCTSLTSGFDNLGAIDSFGIAGPGGQFADINITIGESSRMNTSTPAKSIGASAGNVSEMSGFQTNILTTSWQGYYGNITGTVSLKNAEGASFYEWTTSNPKGEIYATRVSNPVWTSIHCSNAADMDTEDTYLGMNINSSDSLSRTFLNTTTITPFYTGNIRIDNSSNCYATHLFNSSGTQGDTFLEVLLHDENNMIYTALIEPGALGFNGNPYDFELLVGENGKNEDTTPTTYYFFVEIS